LLDRADLNVLFELLESSEPEIVAIAARVLAKRPGVDNIAADRWLSLLHKADPSALDAICGLMQAKLRSETLSLSQLVTLATSRPLPVARLGLRWLRERTPSSTDWPVLVRLCDAEAEPLRSELVRWLRQALTRNGAFETQWLLDYLDGRHED